MTTGLKVLKRGNHSHLAVVMNNLGPYHHVRLNALAEKLRVTAVVLGEPGKGLAYLGWRGRSLYKRVNLQGFLSGIFVGRGPIHIALNNIKPTAVAITGWSELSSWASLEWCLKNNIPRIVMSDTQNHDRPRNWLFELFKGWLVSHFNSALVAGSPQRKYLELLGFPKDRISLGFYAVDNDHFKKHAMEAKKRKSSIRRRFRLPKIYLLLVGRLIYIKGYDIIIRALALTKCSPTLNLVLVGKGPERKYLVELAKDLNLQKRIHFLGPIGYQDLPSIYSLAKALALPSRSEPWGLVANEALASGIPVLASSACGCSKDLLVNTNAGLLINENTPEKWAKAIDSLSVNSHLEHSFANNSWSAVKSWGPSRFVSGMLEAITLSSRKPNSTGKSVLIQLIFLRFLAVNFFKTIFRSG